MSYYLGVDGGGTKTNYVLMDASRAVVWECEGATTDLAEIGEARLREELALHLSALLAENHIEKAQVAYAFLGMPGYGESEKRDRKIDEIAREVLRGIEHRADNDVVAGWAAGTGCAAGIHLVAGTGSIAYGQNEAGNSARVGGWGPGVGDEGSAYWIGLKVLGEYTKQKDGRAARTALVQALEEAYLIRGHFGVAELVYEKLAFTRTNIAAFAQIGSLAAKRGCRRCEAIFAEAAEELFLHVKALAVLLAFREAFLVSYSGGVFAAGDLLVLPLKRLIARSGIPCALKKAELSPGHGAALMAYLLAEKRVGV